MSKAIIRLGTSAFIAAGWAGMAPKNPFQWAHPSNWPWPVYVWLVVFAVGWLKPAWRFFQRSRARDWPSALGKIEYASVSETKRFVVSGTPRRHSFQYEAELSYAYSVAGNAYRGVYKRDFEAEEDAFEFVRDLRGKAVSVLFNPSRPSTSTLSEQSVDTLLQARAPSGGAELSALIPGDSVPSWTKPFLWLFIGLSAIGFVLSLWVHIGALMGRRVAPETFFWILHVGIFVVWLPALYGEQRRVRNAKRKDYWKIALKGCPDWLRYLLGGFGAYAVVNFILFIPHATTGQTGGGPPAVMWRGFSGHWMVFYLTALAMLYSAVAVDEGGWRCLNGHPVPGSTKHCPECGQSVVRSM